jgi:hypothetical protein
MISQTLRLIIFLLAVVVLFMTNAEAKLLKVGPGMEYSKPSQAAKAVNDHDTVEIAAGAYPYDVAIWDQNNLTIRGVGGYAHIQADGAAAGGKAAWVIRGNNTTIENVEFSGARVRDKNGAGIRQEGAGLTIRNCYFHDNEMGILAGNNADSDILIEYSEFARNNVAGDYSKHRRFGHNIYMGRIRSFTLRYSYVHHGKIGNNVKSRALENFILYNRIMDEKEGSSSYLIDLSNGGTAYIIGNLLQQGPHTDNSTLVAFAPEGEKNRSQGLFIINNTFVNDNRTAIYIKNSSQTPAKVVNNIFGSIGDTIIGGTSEMGKNLVTDAPGFVDRSKYDFHLTSTSPAIDAGVFIDSGKRFPLMPEWQYVHPHGKEKRPIIGVIDTGAYEYITQ